MAIESNLARFQPVQRDSLTALDFIPFRLLAPIVPVLLTLYTLVVLMLPIVLALAHFLSVYIFHLDVTFELTAPLPAVPQHRLAGRGAAGVL